MRRAFLFLPLLGLAPASYFLGSYLDGAGVLPGGSGPFISLASVLLLPWVIAALFFTVKIARPARVLLSMAALIVQGVLVFMVAPSGAASETMGLAHRFRREFPPDQMRACAASLRQKAHDGTLVARKVGKSCGFPMSDEDVLVDESELPIPLRGRFLQVFIQTDADSGEPRVYFAIDEHTGIVCDTPKNRRSFSVCPMANGVCAYRYLRP